eukprot:Protomagalhaensia_wolfi_Nauph_80__6341@NODE_991_length_1825_cov_42_852744_g748_i0_p1_GENE_NODE_991_length_1825_cov_42_852744_g748_i0NODE_991_length_1825_cov_42_852744_g748_i0_p1_ORF_typecomplete_len275_score72_19_NODE_991_length_1825_cov_42_852744_g748_i0160984
MKKGVSLCDLFLKELQILYNMKVSIILLVLVVGILASKEEEEYLGQSLGVVVAIQPRLSEPTFSAESLSTPEPPEHTTWHAIPDHDELEKRAVQSVYHRPEPLLARAIALASEGPRTVNLRRLQTAHRRAQRRALKDSISIGSSELSVQDQQALIEGLLASGALLPTNLSSPSSSGTTGSSTIGSSTIGSSTVGSESLGNGSISSTVESTEEEAVTPSPSPLAHLNEVLAGLNSAMGGVTTTTPTPHVAIVRGVDNFIQGINQLVALQLAARQM